MTPERMTTPRHNTNETPSVFGLLAAPPPLPRMAARALVACAIAQRVDLESHPDTREARELIEVANDWLGEHGLVRELDPAEQELLSTAPGALSAAQLERFAPLAECAAVIAWALQRQSLPGAEVDADAVATAESLGWLDDTGATLGTTARLRPRETIMAALDAQGALHWRLLERTRPGSAKISMGRFAPSSYEWPDGMTPFELLEDDLALAGVALADVRPQELFGALRRAQERHRALLWLLGQQRNYWDVTLPA